MEARRMTRRTFFQTTAATTAGIILGSPGTAQAGPSSLLTIEEPFHGAVLNRRHGQNVNDGLKICVSGMSPLGDRVTVNEAVARRVGTQFVSELVLQERETEIVATSKGSFGRHEHRVRVLWDKHSQPRYRFSIDDNSFFLRDIARKDYTSLFDCFYLNMLREMHRKYGARFVLNIYYKTEDGFELPQFPDRYKSEWKDNSNWLRLAFHAYANLPDRPYQ